MKMVCLSDEYTIFFLFEENHVFWINIKYFFLFEAKKFAFQINLKFKSFFMKITYLVDKFKAFR